MGAPRSRFVVACALGLSGVAACGAALHDEATPIGYTPAGDGDELRRGHRRPRTADAGGEAADAGDDDAATRCPNGALEDPHRGFVRCLAPGEADAGWLPPPPQPAPAEDAGADGGAVDAAADAAPDAAPAVAGPPPSVEWSPPVYENGEVPRLEKALKSASHEVARCVAEHGGLGGASGTVKVQFLVRARGRAEGVEVVSAKGVGAEAASCIRLALKNKAIGSPTADPVGVTVTFTLKPAR
jgi:hypothetical protein